MSDFKLPKLANHQDFERLCLEIITAKMKPIVQPSLQGRPGQAQHGVDFVIQLQSGVLHGYQCKSGERIAFAEVVAEVEKTAGYPVPMQSYTVLTAMDPDARLQEDVQALSHKRVQRGEFPVTVVFWRTIESWLLEHPVVLRKYYPQIDPDLTAMMRAAGRRLDEDFPGSRLEHKVAGGSTETVLHPGPDGVPFQSTITGQDAVRRFQEAMESRQQVTFDESEFNLRLPDALAEHGSSPPPEAKVQFTITPREPVRSKDVRLVIEPQDQVGSLGAFLRRGRKSTKGYPATFTVEKVGAEEAEIHIDFRDLPLRLTMVSSGAAGKETAQVKATAKYVGETVERALAAEQLRKTLSEGVYLGVFDEQEDVLAGLTRLGEYGRQETLDGLTQLAELADLAGWDIHIPEKMDRSDLASVPGYLELFRTGRRAVEQGFSFAVTYNSRDELERLRSYLDTAQGQLSMKIEDGPGPISFLGAEHPMPRTRIVTNQVTMADEVLGRIKDGSPPLEVEFQVPNDAEAVQILVEEEDE